MRIKNTKNSEKMHKKFKFDKNIYNLTLLCYNFFRYNTSGEKMNQILSVEEHNKETIKREKKQKKQKNNPKVETQTIVKFFAIVSICKTNNKCWRANRNRSNSKSTTHKATSKIYLLLE